MDTREILGQEYLPRVLDTQLLQALKILGAVVVEGPRAAGKTMTALNVARSYVFLDDPANKQLLEISPHSLLEGEKPRLFDEWQLAPELWNLIRRAVDASTEPGQFILTGSATPSDEATRHTGAGRMLRLRQRTMTWWEKSSRATGAVSLADLFAGKRPKTELGSAWTLADVIDHLIQSGFPAMINLDPAASAPRMRAYIDEVARTDIHRISDLRHHPDLIKQLIAALARSSASTVSFRTLASDVRAIAPSISEETVSTYVGLLEQLFIVEMQRPWTPKLRSRARLRTSPKIHLADASLAAAALGAGAKQLHNDLNTLGILFESAVVHDLSAFADTLEGEVRHYRDSNGKEIDAVICLPDGRWGAVEVKLGGRQAETGIASLREVVSQIDTSAVGAPSFMMVVTGTGPTFTTEDGVVVAPLGELGP